MLDILIVSSEDTCRSRMAKELLNSFGRGMNLFTAGAQAGYGVPETLVEMMAEQGYEISHKKPMAADACRERQWGVVITLCDEAREAVSDLALKAEHMQHFQFDDPLAHRGRSEEEQRAQLVEVYRQMHRELFRYYRDVLSDWLMPSCTCGANTYCRCE